MNRRAWLLAPWLLAAAGPRNALADGTRAAVSYPTGTPRPLVFPRDHGAHPEYRTEWWYLTGWLDAPGRASLGFQVTFFRVRTPLAESASRFAATQLVIAHAAIADAARGALLHDERAQRVAGFVRKHVVRRLPVTVFAGRAGGAQAPRCSSACSIE